MPIICCVSRPSPASGRQAILTTTTGADGDEGAGEAEEVAEAIFNRRTHSVEQALKVASSTIFHVAKRMFLPISRIQSYLLGRPMLQAGKPAGRMTFMPHRLIEENR